MPGGIKNGSKYILLAVATLAQFLSCSLLSKKASPHFMLFSAEQFKIRISHDNGRVRLKLHLEMTPKYLMINAEGI